MAASFFLLPTVLNSASLKYLLCSEDEAAKVLAEHDILVKVDMGTGDASAKAWGCDLTYDYVKINGDYRT